MVIPLPPLYRRAEVRSDSIDPEARTVQVIWSTGADVARTDWLSGQSWIERLSLDPQAVRLDRLNRGAPVLDTHGAERGVRSVIGIVEPGSARIMQRQGIATLRFSRREEVEEIWQDVRDGVLKAISVGYRVHRFRREPGDPEAGKPEVRTAVDWEPYEISLVPMGADIGAQVRQQPEDGRMWPCVLETPGQEDMVMTTSTPTTDTGNALAAMEEARAGAPDEGTSSAEGETRERERIQGILKAVRAARLSQDVADQLIAEGTQLSDARAIIWEHMERAAAIGPPPGPSGAPRVISDPLDSIRRGITQALLYRIDPSTWPVTDIARPYVGQPILRCAEEWLEARGVRTRHRSRMEIAALALGLETRAGMHTTSDFPEILADVASKTLRLAYDEAPQTFAPIARRVPLPDFKPVRRVQLGEAPALVRVLEHGEFSRGTVGEGKEQFALATYGRIFAITRQALVNDDLDAFGRLTTMFGRSARNLESDLVWAELLRNEAMGDGIPLFHASHGNLASSGGAISIPTLSAGRAAMRRQKGLDGRTVLNLMPQHLIVPPDLETVAQQHTIITQGQQTLTPTQPSNVNPFASLMTVIVEPRLEGITLLGPTGEPLETITGSATAWYLAAGVNRIDLIEYGFLDGEEGPVLESRAGWDVDGLEIKCRHDFAAKVIDYRGFYRNPGA